MSDINVTVQDEIVNIDVIDTPVLVEVTNSPGPAGAGVAAGGTTGQVLAKNSSTNYDTVWVNQSGGVPYSGATGNVNLGEYELKAGQVTLDTSPTGTAAVGTIRWNDTTGTSETTLKGGNVIIKNGVDLVARVVNKVSPNTTLTKAAYQAVRVSGAQGQRLAIELAQANNDAGSADTIGLVTETIAPNQEGFIMTVGQLEGINTTGSLQGETWVDGDVLYLSPTTAGALTNIKPTAVTGHIVVVGYVEYAHANNGKIYVKVMNGWELDELHNVSIVTPTNNQGLFYNSSNSLWENKTIDTALGFTPVPTTRNITINGVTYDLSADRTWTIAAGISGSGAAGQVTYWTGASAVSGSNNLFWDNSNGRLGIGTNAPEFITDIKSAAFPYLQIQSTTDTQSSNGRAGIRLARGSSSTLTGVDFVKNDLDNLEIRRVTVGSATTWLTLFRGTGNLVLQNGGTFTDGGQRLQVQGDAFIKGSGNTTLTTGLTVQNSDGLTTLAAYNNGLVYARRIIVNLTGLVANGTPTDLGANYLSFTNNGTIYYSVANGTQANNGGIQIYSSATLNPTTNTPIELRVGSTFAPTSGTATYTNTLLNPTINQTGGANGITRGLYVNPTLTAAADFRAIETTAGNVLFGSNFFWDNTNGRLGIGTNAPNSLLQGISGVSDFRFSTGSSGITPSLVAINTSGAGKAVGLLAGTTAGAFAFDSAGAFFILSESKSAFTGNTLGNGSVRIAAFGSTGNVAINSSVDPGVRLGVFGDTLLRGSGATSATTALTVQNSSSTNLFTVRNDGLSTVNRILSSTGTESQGTLISGSASTRYTTNTGVNTNAVYANAVTTGADVWVSYVGGSSVSDIYTYFQSSGYIGTRGALRLGSANGTDTITSVTNTWLSIAAGTTTRSQINLAASTAPTTPNNGDIWFDGTDIKMRIGGVTKTFTLV